MKEAGAATATYADACDTLFVLVCKLWLPTSSGLIGLD